MGWWRAIWKTKASTWTYARIPANKNPEGLSHVPAEPESGYLGVWLTSFRIRDVRKGLKKFYGTVHSFINLPVLDGKKADFQVVTTPGNLQSVDAKNIDRIIVLNQRLLGPIPYRGGDLTVEVGLFSVKEADLAGPFLSVLESMSKVAGVSFVSAALPFAGPIRDGINLLAGAGDDSILEIGMSQVYQPVESGYFVIMRAKQGQVDPAKFRIDNGHQLVDDQSGQSIGGFPYLVFRIDLSPRRDAWFMVPELATAHEALREAIRQGQRTHIDETFAVFKRTALTCPDLLLADAQQLVRKVESEVAGIVVPTATAKALGATVRPLQEVDLYK